jgi:hypothetical protein
MFNDNVQTQVIGTLHIKDKETGETLVKKRNAIHPGNMAYVIASSLAGSSLSIVDLDVPPSINWMAFGNGGSSSTTTLSYRSPRISEIYDELPYISSTSALYSKTYHQKTNNTVYFPGQDMGDGEIVPNRTSKINFRVEMSHDDYEAMQREVNPNITTPLTDSSTDTTSVNAFTFDEIGLVAGFEQVANDKIELVEDKSLLVTHVTFHPVLLSANRTIVIDYTITIQVS